MAYVELQGVTAGYVAHDPVLRDFSLHVERGELLSLLGPSGCGKTTTLRTIAGFLLAQEGRVVVNGRDYTRLPPNKRNIGIVFQTYALFPHLSVFDNVAYGLRRRRVSRQEISTRVAGALDLVSLTGFEERLPAHLSGGQRQRVALARAIVIEPDLLLLDEPLSNLDAKLRDEMRGELARLQKQLGITMIYVTHDQIEALSLSSRIVVMNQGVIEQSDTPQAIFERPATPFVAHFMGFDNVLAGTCREVSGDTAVVRVGGHRFECRLPPGGEGLSTGQAVRLLFRPVDVRFVGTGGADRPNTLPVRIEFFNYQGTGTLCGLVSEDQRLTAVVDGTARPADTDLHVQIEPGAILLDTVTYESAGGKDG